MLIVAHDVNPIASALDGVVYVARGRAVSGTPDEVITTETLSALYGTPIEVLTTSDGRRVVVGQPDAASHHAGPHGHAPRPRRTATSRRDRRDRPLRSPRSAGPVLDPVDDLRRMLALHFMVNAFRAGDRRGRAGRGRRLVHGAAPAELRRPHPGRGVVPRGGRRHLAGGERHGRATSPGASPPPW